MTVGVKSGPSDPGTRSVCISFWMTRACGRGHDRGARGWCASSTCAMPLMRSTTTCGWTRCAADNAGSRERDLALFQTVLEQFVDSFVVRQGISICHLQDSPVEHQARQGP